MVFESDVEFGRILGAWSSLEEAKNQVETDSESKFADIEVWEGTTMLEVHSRPRPRQHPFLWKAENPR